MPKLMTATKIGDYIELSREQWKGHIAHISDYPGLLDEVQKYTWTYSDNGHAYLNCSKINTSLHKFVLSYLYGEEALNTVLQKGNIIEHLDNDGLNCAYDNLHIIDEDYNKAKAFTIDKQQNEVAGIPSFITDVYYSHKKGYYQMQITFNRDMLWRIVEGIRKPVEMLICRYTSFPQLFTDWLDVLGARKNGVVDPRKLNPTELLCDLRPEILLTEDEKDHCIIERDGICYMVLRTDDPYKAAFIVKAGFRHIEDE